MIEEACREYTHLGDQSPHPTPNRILAPTAAGVRGVKVGTANVNPVGDHSEIFLQGPRMPKIVGERAVGAILAMVIMELLHYLVIQVD